VRRLARTANQDPDLTYRGNYSLQVLHIVEYTS
jgi:hypothetical protein